MTEWTGTWSAAEAAAFLGATTVPLRLAYHTPAGQLWIVSLWYRYADGHLECATASTADVVAGLEADPAVAFEVSTEDPPYAGVRGRGRAAIEPDPEKALLRRLLRRYLGGTATPLADRLLADGRDEVTIRIDVERAYSWDFTDRMASATADVT